MKTVHDLNALIPAIVKEFESMDFEIGDYYEEGYKTNFFYYEEDGWEITIEFQCTGYFARDDRDYWTCGAYEIVKAWGDVVEINGHHLDEETDEESDFDAPDFKEIEKAVNEVLKDIESY